ncbi:MAG: glycosyltransferase family 2 protein [Planctomycetes bacterium]|nr:glycosyltransferase family 2 protein [Planctomycetota bacterium]
MSETTPTEIAPIAFEEARRRYLNLSPRAGRASVAAVMTSFNKREDVRRNLDGIRAQTIPFDEVIVVDNHSSDGTQEMVRRDYPEVTFIEMHDSSYGACETFNIGFGNATTDFVAILDDDVILPPEWVAKVLAKFAAEPETTGLISSKVIEPGTPDWYDAHPAVNAERYMATFRGCATMARRDVLARAGYYDEHFFIYGNERDLSCRVLNLGYRILQFPEVEVRHGTPFGMKKTPRSLYYHVRNLWLYLFKNVAFTKILGFVLRLFLKPLLPRRKSAEVTADAVGSIGGFSMIRETRNGLWICIKATVAAFWSLPYCLKRRQVCRAQDFELPVK